MLDRLQQAHNNRVKDFLRRSRTEIESTHSPYILVAGKKYLSFSSNNYLGLATHPDVITAANKALIKYGVGSGSAYLLGGYTSLHHQLEEALAAFLQYPKVLLFSSGYLANIGVISALFSKSDLIIADKLVHASLIDGCLKSGAKFYRYPHCKPAQIEKICQKVMISSKLIVSEGLFGMDGTLVPLRDLVKTAKKHQAMLLIDDAHGIGVLGTHGRGTLELNDLGCHEVNLLVGTLGKAFGTYGAFVAGDEYLIDSIMQTARTYLYTTATPPAIVASSLTSLKLIQEESWRRDKLFDLIQYFKKCANQLNIPCHSSDTPIQPIHIGCNEKALKVSESLLQKGLFVKAIRPPTVPKNSARLRISLTTEHTFAHINFLLETVVDALQKR